MKSFRKTVVAAALASLLGFSGAASANIIDLFSEPAGGVQAVGVGGFTDALPDQSEYFNAGGSIIGSYRDLALRNVTGTSGTNGSRLSVADNRLGFANDPNVRATAVVQWDGGPEGAGTEGTLQFGLDANLINQTGCPAIGCSFFQSVVYNADQGFTIELGVYTDADTFSRLVFTSAAVNAPQPSIFLFEWFNTAGLDQMVEPGFVIDVFHGADGMADFTDVSALELLFSNAGGNAAIDLEIGAIQKFGVPEPGALALAGLALISAAAVRRRRKA